MNQLMKLLGGSNRIASTSLDNGSSDPTAETLLTKLIDNVG